MALNTYIKMRRPDGMEYMELVHGPADWIRLAINQADFSTGTRFWIQGELSRAPVPATEPVTEYG